MEASSAMPKQSAASAGTEAPRRDFGLVGLTVLLLIAGIAAAGCSQAGRAENSGPNPEGPSPSEAKDEGEDTAMKTATATFAAGCFWGVEQAFRDVKGVADTAVGYTGGTTKNPTYEQVCAKTTGHAEAVRVEFDPAVISYEQLLEVFWKIHDPTQKNRQGPDIGSQYRSAIFYHTPEQAQAARASKSRLEASGRLGRPVATEITPAAEFYRAEEYHQRYLEKRGGASCHLGL